MNGTKSLTTRTLFPLVATRPASYQFRSAHTKKAAKLNVKLTLTVIEEPVAPQYTTEAAVTSAIADRSFKGHSAAAYAAAILYQKQLKRFNRLSKKK